MAGKRTLQHPLRLSSYGPGVNDRRAILRSVVALLTLSACAPRTTSTTLPLRYFASKDALFDTIVTEAPRRYVVVNPLQGQFELVSENRELGVISLAYDLRDIYGPARQSATFQLFNNRDGTVDVVTAATTTSRLGYPLLAEALVKQVVTTLDQRYQRLRRV